MSTVEQLRDHAGTLPEVEEGTHFRLPAFRVRESVFVVLQPNDYAVLHVDAGTADEAARSPAVEPTYRGSTLVGVRVHLPAVGVVELRRLVTAAWRHRAPKQLRDAHQGMTD
jgi:hypothetical protein